MLKPFGQVKLSQNFVLFLQFCVRSSFAIFTVSFFCSWIRTVIFWFQSVLSPHSQKWRGRGEGVNFQMKLEDLLVIWTQTAEKQRKMNEWQRSTEIKLPDPTPEKTAAFRCKKNSQLDRLLFTGTSKITVWWRVSGAGTTRRHKFGNCLFVYLAVYTCTVLCCAQQGKMCNTTSVQSRVRLPGQWFSRKDKDTAGIMGTSTPSTFLFHDQDREKAFYFQDFAAGDYPSEKLGGGGCVVVVVH